MASIDLKTLSENELRSLLSRVHQALTDAHEFGDEIDPADLARTVGWDEHHDGEGEPLEPGAACGWCGWLRLS